MSFQFFENSSTKYINIYKTNIHQMRKVYFIIPIIILVSLVILYNLLFSQKEGLTPGTIPIPKDATGKYLPIPDGYMKLNADEMAPIPPGYKLNTDGLLVPSDGSQDIINGSQRYSGSGSSSGSRSNSGSDSGIKAIPKGSDNKYSAIPSGYMQINESQMEKIPYGYTLSFDKTSLVPTPGMAPYNEMLSRGSVSIPTDSSGKKLPVPPGFIKLTDTTMARIPVNISIAEYKNTLSSLVTGYDANNLDAVYHDDGNWEYDQESTDLSTGGQVNYETSSGSGSRRSSPYVPTYEDSIYYSTIDGKTYIDPETGTEITPPEISGGFCSAYASLPNKLEEACSKMDNTSCGSTTCCVLVGGTRCMAGNETGPTNQAIYSDLTLLNKDYYYYQGKCYGNCNK